MAEDFCERLRNRLTWLVEIDPARAVRGISAAKRRINSIGEKVSTSRRTNRQTGWVSGTDEAGRRRVEIGGKAIWGRSALPGVSGSQRCWKLPRANLRQLGRPDRATSRPE